MIAGDPGPFSAADKLEAVERELRFRQRVYSDRVEADKMTASFAARQIGLFEAIRDDYAKQAEAGRLL